MESEEWKNTFTKKVSWFNEKIIPEQIFANSVKDRNSTFAKKVGCLIETSRGDCPSPLHPS